MLRVVMLVVLSLLFVLPVTAQIDPQDFADPDGQFIDVNGVDTYVRLLGPEDGPGVVLLHGFLGSSFDWRFNADALAEAGYRVVTIDMPPYGLSEKVIELDYSHPGFAAFVRDVLDTLELDTVTMVGHSMGGNVLAHFALNYPERLERAVFVSAAVMVPSGGPTVPAGLLDSPLVSGLLNNIFRSALDSARESANLSEEEEARLAATFEMEGWNEAFIEVIRASENNAVDLDRLDEISVPVLMIWGEADDIVPVTDGEQLRELIAGSVWIAYPEIGHTPMQENVDQFNADLLEFLDS